jgi:hypothetical protein
MCMDRKRLQVLLFLVIFSLSVSSVAAAMTEGIFKPLADLGLWESFGKYPFVWDIIIVFTVFIVVGSAVLGKTLGTPGRGGTVGFAMAGITLGGMYVMQFSLVRDLGPYMVVGIVAALTILFIRFFMHWGDNKSIGAIGIFLALSLLTQMPKISDVLIQNSLLYSILYIAWILSGIFFIVRVIQLMSDSAASSSGAMGNWANRALDAARELNSPEAQERRRKKASGETTPGDMKGLRKDIERYGKLVNNLQGASQNFVLAVNALNSLPPGADAKTHDSLYNTAGQRRAEVMRQMDAIRILYAHIHASPHFEHLDAGVQGQFHSYVHTFLTTVETMLRPLMHHV